MTTLQLHIEGMTCAGCVNTIEQALLAVEGVELATVSLINSSAQVTYSEPPCKPGNLISAINQAGYHASVINMPLATSSQMKRPSTIQSLGPLIQLSLCAALTLLVMALSWLPIHLPNHAQWLLGLSTVVLLVGGGGMLLKAARALATSNPLTMDTLLSLSILSTYGLSLWTINQMHNLDSWTFHHVPFEMMCFLITVVLLGRFLEARARHKTGELSEALLRLQPGTVKRISADDNSTTDESIPLAQVQIDDLIRVAPGEALSLIHI